MMKEFLTRRVLACDCLPDTDSGLLMWQALLAGLCALIYLLLIFYVWEKWEDKQSEAWFEGLIEWQKEQNNHQPEDGDEPLKSTP